MTDREQVVKGILADEELRSRLLEALSEEIAERHALSWRNRAVAFLTGLSSAAVVLLAFLIPSSAELWDRYESRATIARYEEIGRRLLAQRKYTAAEQAFDHALELAGNARHDLYEYKLRARVGRVEEDSNWHGEVPEDLTESDYLYLLEADNQPSRARERALTLTAFGVFLVAKHRIPEAEHALREAIRIDPSGAKPHVDLANLLADQGETAGAEAALRRALELDPKSGPAHYDLGLLLAEGGRAADAEKEFRSYTQITPNVAKGFVRLAEQLKQQGKSDEARKAYEQALRIDRTDTEAKAGLGAP
jgi:tetratricopeptide (TPR) repeat protein